MSPDEPVNAEANRAAEAHAAALQSLATNPTFRELWIEGYMREDMETKLQQLRKCSVEDLPIARQRWLDAENAYREIKRDIERLQQPLIPESAV